MCKHPRSTPPVQSCQATPTRDAPRLENLEERIVLSSLISISNASLVEGDSGSSVMNFTVTRTGDMGPQIVVGYSTANGTAIAGTDYTATSGNVVIPAGSSFATISVPVIGNLLVQANRSFSVNLTSATPSGVVPANTYSFATTTGNSLATLTSPITIVTTGIDDGSSPVTSMGFGFNFAGTTYANFSASSNGLMALGTTPVTSAYENATTGATFPGLMPFWDDLRTSTVNGVGIRCWVQLLTGSLLWIGNALITRQAVLGHQLCFFRHSFLKAPMLFDMFMAMELPVPRHPSVL